MLSYIIKRLLRMIPQLFLISLLAFIIIQLPPGDYLTEYINRLRASGQGLCPEP
jgi:peptide/nickel transport system permease protein